MKERRQTKAQLLTEVAALRQQVAELQAAVSALQQQDSSGQRQPTEEPLQLVGAATDISQHQQTERKLQQSEARYRNLFENANDAIAVVNLDRSIASINRAMEKLLGWSREELIGQDYYTVLTSSGIALAEERVSRLQAGEKIPSIFEHDFLCKDGSTVPIEGRIRFIRNEAGAPIGFQGIYRDITERKLAEQRLQAERNFATQIMTTMGQGLVVVGADYHIEYANPAALRMFGYQIEDVIGKSATSFIVPEDESRLLQVRERLWRGETLMYEMRVRRADGQYLPALITAAPRLNEGKITDTIQTISDLTERKQAEEERQQLQAQLFQVQKLEAVGTLAGGIAHEFNNLLAAMLGYGELIMDDVPQGTVTRGNVEEVLKAGRRAKALVQQLLTFSRSDQGDRHRLRLQPVVEETLKFLSAMLPKSVQLYHDLACPTEIIVANPIQIQQVITNLFINAIQAMEEQGGTLRIGLRRSETADGPGRTTGHLPPGPCLVLTIHDTGCGMNPEVLERMYEPFFTSKEVGKGTGLGLAVVYSIVTSHSGAIKVDSLPGQGTTFHVYLPLAHGNFT